MANSQPAYRMSSVDVSGSDVDFTIDPFDAVYIGGTGNLVFVDKADNESTVPVFAGQILPCGGITIKSTANGTTATNIFALFNSL